MTIYTTKATYPYTLFSQYKFRGDPNTYIFGNAHFDNPLLSGTVTLNQVKNANWKILRAKGQDVTNPYQVSGYRVKSQVSRAQLYDKTGNVNTVYDSFDYMRFITGPTSWSSTNSSLDNLALTRLKRKLKKQVGGFDSLVPIAEFKDLATTIRSAVELTKGTVQALIDIKHGKWGRVKAFQKASKAWLTYGFGIRPIISDINSLNQAISSFITRSDRSLRIAGSAKTDWLTSNKYGGTTCNRLGAADSHVVISHELSYRYVAGFKLPLKAGNNYTAMEHFGLDFPSVLPALWEATAFSWVLDYFTNVGEFLEDTFVSPPGNTIYVSKNRRYTANCRIVQTVNKTGANVAVTYEYPAVHQVEYFDFERVALGSQLPRIGLRVRTADEVGKFGVSKLLNLVSILGSKSRLV